MIIRKLALYVLLFTLIIGVVPTNAASIQVEEEVPTPYEESLVHELQNIVTEVPLPHLGSRGDGQNSLYSMAEQPWFQLFAGNTHSGMVRVTGGSGIWGSNIAKQLGMDEPSESLIPLNLTIPLGKKADAGVGSTIALQSDGTVRAWGFNLFGTLGGGLNGPMYEPNPVAVQTSQGVLLDQITDISTSHLHSLALRSDGTVWGWGFNLFGELGVGPINDGLEFWARQVRGSGGHGYLTDVVQISAGGTHSVALKTNGTVWSWGANDRGQLGNGSTMASGTPVATYVWPFPVLPQVKSVSAGYDFTVVLGNDGTVWSWGSNDQGQLGDGTTNDRMYPARVKGVGGSGYLSNVVAISSGHSHVLALKADGTVWSWGNNNYGQSGNGLLVAGTLPTPVLLDSSGTPLQHILSIEAGSYHSMAVNQNYELLAWGRNDAGQLGIGNKADQSFPVQVQLPEWTVNIPIEYEGEYESEYFYGDDGRLDKVYYYLSASMIVIEKSYYYDANGNLLYTSIGVLQ